MTFSNAMKSALLALALLGLTVPAYDPQVHYHQVRDAWVGVRTPDGR